MGRLLWVVWLAILSLAASSAPVSDAAHTFSIELTPGWSVAEPAATPLRIMAPAEAGRGFRGNVGIEVLLEATRLTPQRKAEFRTQLSNLVPGLKFTGEADVTVGGAPAWKVSYRGRVKDVGVAGYSIVMSRDEHTWILTFLTGVAAYARQDTAVQTMLSTFKILL